MLKASLHLPKIPSRLFTAEIKKAHTLTHVKMDQV